MPEAKKNIPELLEEYLRKLIDSQSADPKDVVAVTMALIEAKKSL